MKNLLIVCLLIGSLIGCAEIKPLQLPQYNPPDLSHVVRPEIPKPVKGVDVFFDKEKNTITYTITGQNLLTEKIQSEEMAWRQIELLKQIVGTQSEIIQQKDQLIIIIDLKRQYAEREKFYSNVNVYVSWIIDLIFAALLIAK